MVDGYNLRPECCTPKRATAVLRSSLAARDFFDGSEMLMKTTLWLFNIAMGNGPFIDGLPIKNRDFP